MDLHQIEYIIAIEQEGSISKAAARLFLTQSALNQQLLRLEKELGTPLFERKKHGMIPTYAGRMYLTTARQMVDMKQQTYRIIHDICEENTGEISLSYTPERGSLMFSQLYPVFHAKYPQISFRIHEARGRKMEQLLLQKEVTLACTAYDIHAPNPDFEYWGMSEELIVLGLPASHPLAHLAGERSWETFPEIDLNLLRSEKFTMNSKETILRSMVDDAFIQAGYHPHVLFESSSTLTVVNMVRNQVGPAFFPQSYVEKNAPIVYFSISPRRGWMRSVAFLKGTYLTRPEKYFIELVRRYHVGEPLTD